MSKKPCNYPSHAMHYMQRVEPTPPALHYKSLVLGATKVVEDGVVAKSVDYVVDDSEHRFDGMTMNDFALENLMDAGVALSPVLMTKNPLNMIDSCECELSKLKNLSDSLKS